MATTPAPVLRIRIVSHPPLTPLKAWLPIPSPTSTIQQLAATVSAMLGGVQIELELMGFALMLESPCSILDPVNDILDIKLATSQPIPLPIPPPAMLSQPKATQAAQKAALPKPKPVASSSSDSSSSDSSDSSDSDSDDDGPEVQSTGPPIHHAPTSNPPPAKRAKLMPTTTLKTSATKVNGASSSSSSSSDSSESSSDSDSSDSDSSTPATAAKVSIAESNAVISSHPPVPPGSGLKKTQQRNARKRALKQFRAASEKESEISSTIASTSHSTPSPSVPSNSKSNLKSTTKPAADYVAPPAKKAAGDKSLPLDPYYDFAGPKLDMLHLVKGNKNKKKTIRIPKEGGKGSVGLRTTWAEESGNVVRGEKEREVSPSWVPGSPIIAPSLPIASSSTLSTETSLTTPNAKTAYKDRKKPWKKPGDGIGHPSQRQDLPPNVFVTVVDVEHEWWASRPGKVVKGTSQEWKGWKEVAAEESGEEKGKEVAMEVEVEEQVEKEQMVESVIEVQEDIETSGEWAGFPSLVSVERRWDSFAILPSSSSSSSGAKVISKVLELDPLTFTPTLSTKYGLLLPSSTNSLLSIKLHPSCLPKPEYLEEAEWEGEDGYGEDGEEGYGGEYGKPKMRFGQPIEESEALGAE
ncbi:hypothetical protein P7C70_g8118, partial [Phenoliferia sp. Uapishka_3]